VNLGIETEQIEFKKSTKELKEGVASIASILNKHGKGELYFGVAPNGDVVGRDVAESTLRQISQAIGNSIEPPIRPEITKETTPEGAEYVRVAFEGDDAPYACSGKYRIRVADEDILMTTSEIRAMIMASEQKVNPWDSRAANRPVKDVNENVLKDYVARGQEAGRIGFDYDGVVPVLERLGLMVDDKLTNAADVLFCKSKNTTVKCAVFGDAARTNILDSQHFEGTLFELAKYAEDYILRNIRRRFVIDGKTMQRQEIPELPMDAVREVLINALAHMDYEGGYSLQVEIFYDTVQIFSTGWFPEGHDPAKHLSGEDRRTKPRNSLIARALYRSKDIESEASGMPRVQNACDAMNIRIEYTKVIGGTNVVFHRNDPFMEIPLTDVAEASGEITSEQANRQQSAAIGSNRQQSAAIDLTPKEQDILRAFADNKNESLCLSSSEISKIVSMGRSQTNALLKSLVEKGLIVAEGNSVSRVYRLKKTTN
jgi:ATP-dependent DNA helicase RecG